LITEVPPPPLLLPPSLSFPSLSSLLLSFSPFFPPPSFPLLFLPSSPPPFLPLLLPSLPFLFPPSLFFFLFFFFSSFFFPPSPLLPFSLSSSPLFL
ncbi:hypothetical protein ACXWR7_10155, partial [Streptococcus pyogenes]